MGGLKPRFASRIPAKAGMVDVNPHLMCQLCSGYLVDATAIIECQHTFCKSCILKYLDTNSYCPICDVQLNKAKPNLSLRADTTLQRLVYKLVPGLFATEVRRRREYRAKHPTSALPPPPPPPTTTAAAAAGGTGAGATNANSDGSATTAASSSAPTTTTALPSAATVELEDTEDLCVLVLDDAVSLSLEYLKSHEDEEKEKTTTTTKPSPAPTNNNVVVLSGAGNKATTASTCSDKANDRRYLQCPAAVSVGLLKKFIRMKYGLSDDYRVDLLYNGDRDNNLENDLTLLDLAFIYKWKKTEPMSIHYQIYDRPLKGTLVRPGNKRLASSMMDYEPPDDDEAASGPPPSNSNGGSASMTSASPSKLARISDSSGGTTGGSNTNTSSSNKRGATTASNNNNSSSEGNKGPMVLSIKGAPTSSPAEKMDTTSSAPGSMSPPGKKVKTRSRSHSKELEREPSPPQTRSSLTLKLSKRFDSSAASVVTGKRRRSSTSSNASSSHGNHHSSKDRSSKGKGSKSPDKSYSSSSSCSSSPMSPKDPHHPHPSLKISLKSSKYHHHHHHHKHHKHKSKDRERKHKAHKGSKKMTTRRGSKDESEEESGSARTKKHETTATKVSTSNSNIARVSMGQGTNSIPRSTTVTSTTASISHPEPKKSTIPPNNKQALVAESHSPPPHNFNPSPSPSPAPPPPHPHPLGVPESVQLQVPKSVTLIPVNPNAPQNKLPRNQEKPPVNRNTFTHPITNKSLHQITVTEVPPPKPQPGGAPNNNSSPHHQGSSINANAAKHFADGNNPGKHFNAPDGMEITKIYCDNSKSSFEAAGKKLKERKGLDITISASPMSSGSASLPNNNGNSKKKMDESLTFTPHNNNINSGNKNKPLLPPSPQQLQQQLSGQQHGQKLLKQLGQQMQQITPSGGRPLQANSPQGNKMENATKSRKSSLSIEAAKPGSVSVSDQQQQLGGGKPLASGPASRKTIGNLDSSIAIYEVGSMHRTPTPPKEKGLVVTPIPNNNSSSGQQGNNNKQQQLQVPAQPLGHNQNNKRMDGNNKGNNSSHMQRKGQETSRKEQSGPLDLSGKSSRDMKEGGNRPPTPSKSPGMVPRSSNSPGLDKRTKQQQQQQQHQQQLQQQQSSQTQTMISIAQTLAQKQHQLHQQQQQQQHHHQQQQQHQKKSSKQQHNSMGPPSGMLGHPSKGGMSQGNRMEMQGLGSNNPGLSAMAHHSLSPPMIPMPTPSPPGSFNPLRNLLTLSDAASLHKMQNNSLNLNSSLNQLVAAAAGLCPPPSNNPSALSPPSPSQMMSSSPNSILNSSLSSFKPNPLTPTLGATPGSAMSFPKGNLLSPNTGIGWPGGMNLPRGMLSSALGSPGASSLSPPLNPLFSSLGAPSHVSPPMSNNSGNSNHSNSPASGGSSQRSSLSSSLRIPNPKGGKESTKSTPQWAAMGLYSSTKNLVDNNKSLISSQASHILRSSSLTSGAPNSNSSNSRPTKLNGSLDHPSSHSISNPTTFVAPSAIKPMSKSQGQMAKNAIPNSMKISNFLPPPQSKSSSVSSNLPATITSSSSNLAKYLSNLPPLMPPQSPPGNDGPSNNSKQSGRAGNNKGAGAPHSLGLSNPFSFPLSSSMLPGSNTGNNPILPPKNFTSNNSLMSSSSSSARTLPISVATAGSKGVLGNEGSFTLAIDNNSSNKSRASQQPPPQQNQAVRHIPNPSLLLNRQQSSSNNNSLSNAVNNQQQQITVQKHSPSAITTTTSAASASSLIPDTPLSVSNLMSSSNKSSILKPSVGEEIGKLEKIVQEKKRDLLGQQERASPHDREPKKATQEITRMEEILEEIRKRLPQQLQAQMEAEKQQLDSYSSSGGSSNKIIHKKEETGEKFSLDRILALKEAQVSLEQERLSKGQAETSKDSKEKILPPIIKEVLVAPAPAKSLETPKIVEVKEEIIKEKEAPVLKETVEEISKVEFPISVSKVGTEVDTPKVEVAEVVKENIQEEAPLAKVEVQEAIQPGNCKILEEIPPHVKDSAVEEMPTAESSKAQEQGTVPEESEGKPKVEEVPMEEDVEIGAEGKEIEMEKVPGEPSLPEESEPDVKVQPELPESKSEAPLENKEEVEKEKPEISIPAPEPSRHEEDPVLAVEIKMEVVQEEESEVAPTIPGENTEMLETPQDICNSNLNDEVPITPEKLEIPEPTPAVIPTPSEPIPQENKTEELEQVLQEQSVAVAPEFISEQTTEEQQSSSVESGTTPVESEMIESPEKIKEAEKEEEKEEEMLLSSEPVIPDPKETITAEPSSPSPIDVIASLPAPEPEALNQLDPVVLPIEPPSIISEEDNVPAEELSLENPIIPEVSTETPAEEEEEEETGAILLIEHSELAVESSPKSSFGTPIKDFDENSDDLIIDADATLDSTPQSKPDSSPAIEETEEEEEEEVVENLEQQVEDALDSGPTTFESSLASLYPEFELRTREPLQEPTFESMLEAEGGNEELAVKEPKQEEEEPMEVDETMEETTFPETLVLEKQEEILQGQEQEQHQQQELEEEHQQQVLEEEQEEEEEHHQQELIEGHQQKEQEEQVELPSDEALTEEKSEPEIAQEEEETLEEMESEQVGAQEEEGEETERAEEEAERVQAVPIDDNDLLFPEPAENPQEAPAVEAEEKQEEEEQQAARPETLSFPENLLLESLIVPPSTDEGTFQQELEASSGKDSLAPESNTTATTTTSISPPSSPSIKQEPEQDPSLLIKNEFPSEPLPEQEEQVEDECMETDPFLDPSLDSDDIPMDITDSAVDTIGKEDIKPLPSLPIPTVEESLLEDEELNLRDPFVGVQSLDENAQLLLDSSSNNNNNNSGLSEETLVVVETMTPDQAELPEVEESSERVPEVEEEEEEEEVSTTTHLRASSSSPLQAEMKKMEESLEKVAAGFLAANTINNNNNNSFTSGVGVHGEIPLGSATTTV